MPGSHRKGGAKRGRRPAHGTSGGPGSSYHQRGLHSSDHVNTRASASGGSRYPKYRRIPTGLPMSRAYAVARRTKSVADAYDSAARDARRTQSRTTRSRQQANAARKRKAKTRTASKRRRR